MTTFKELKDAYEIAKKKKVKTFFVGDHEFVFGYAKYMIEWLSSKQGITDNTELDITPTTEKVEQ